MHTNHIYYGHNLAKYYPIRNIHWNKLIIAQIDYCANWLLHKLIIFHKDKHCQKTPKCYHNLDKGANCWTCVSLDDCVGGTASLSMSSSELATNHCAALFLSASVLSLYQRYKHHYTAKSSPTGVEWGWESQKGSQQQWQKQRLLFWKTLSHASSGRI